MFSTAPAGGLVPLVPTRFTEFHISSPVPSMCLRAKDYFEGTKVAVSPSLCAPQERPVRQRSGLAVTEEWRPGRRRGDLATRRGAGDPETRAEWMAVSRYGHLRSAPVVVDAASRKECEPPTLFAALSISTRPCWAPPRWHLSSPASYGTQRSRRSRDIQNAFDPEVRERCRVIPTADRPSGLCWPLRHPILADGPHSKQFRRSRRRRDELRTEVDFPTISRPRGLWASLRYPVQVDR